MTELPKKASVVIVGGGAQGLSCAFNLAKLGVKDIVVLDAGYWQGGASGRNGTMIRPGFLSPEWTRFFQYSWEQWTGLSKRLGHNVMFTERGYTMIAEEEPTARMFEEACGSHGRYGVKSEMLSPAGMSRQMPALNRRNVTGALSQPRAGMAPHHAVMKGFLLACRTEGVTVRYRTKVTAFDLKNNRIAGVLVGDHRIACDTVVSAAGPYSSDFVALAGVKLEGYMLRIEAIALEPMRPLLKPAIALIDSNSWFHQTSRGEFVGGTEVPEQPQNTLRSDIPSIAAMARNYVRFFPQLAETRILRQWGGMMHIAPDFSQTMGPHPQMPGLWITAGWTYGFSGAPGSGLMMARAIVKNDFDERMLPFSVDRFERGKPVKELGISLS